MNRHGLFVALTIMAGACLMSFAFSSQAFSADPEAEEAFIMENLMPARQGDPQAQLFVGFLYETGQGVRQDSRRHRVIKRNVIFSIVGQPLKNVLQVSVDHRANALGETANKSQAAAPDKIQKMHMDSQIVVAGGWRKEGKWVLWQLSLIHL